MTPRGAKAGGQQGGHSLLWRSDQLAEALEAGGDELDPDTVRQAHGLNERVRARWELKGGRTVVCLAGATGSGKSSLFNRLADAEVSTVGARRPTTSTASAAIWGQEPSHELLDWLGVPHRHEVGGNAETASTRAGRSEDAVDLDGLVLIDLPDFDSREASHRVEADRILQRSDVFVWVTDPQKYADARLHEEYLSTLRDHDGVMIVVLNQVDRVGESAVQQIADDLRSLVKTDGAGDFEVIPTSARLGVGLPELTRRIAEVVTARNAAEQRLSGDIVAMVRRLRSGVADTDPQVDDDTSAELNAALARAAGVPVVLRAVRQDYLRQSAARAGWPFTRWVAGLRPDPLRRLRLGKPATKPGSVIASEDVQAVLGRSSLPPATPAARSAVDVATRALADRAGRDLPRRWADAVDDAATPDDSSLGDALDQAVMNTPLRDKNPLWWPVWSFLQLLLALAVIVGAGWLTLLFALQWAQIEMDAPMWGPVPIPIPLLLFAGGIVAGLVLAGLGRVVARSGATRRQASVRRRMDTAIATVAAEHVRGPVSAVLKRHRQTRQQLDAAGST
ncbi:MAG: GTPase [Ornithinimicrobium sp.]